MLTASAANITTASVGSQLPLETSKKEMILAGLVIPEMPSPKAMKNPIPRAAKALAKSHPPKKAGEDNGQHAKADKSERRQEGATR